MTSAEGARLGAEAAHRLALTGQFQMIPGLTDTEIDRVEREYGFEFADDHRAFLQAALPVNNPPEKYQAWRRPWPDWRDGDPQELREQLSWPVEGALFDVEHNAFWYPAWGPCRVSRRVAESHDQWRTDGGSATSAVTPSDKWRFSDLLGLSGLSRDSEGNSGFHSR